MPATASDPTIKNAALLTQVMSLFGQYLLSGDMKFYNEAREKAASDSSNPIALPPLASPSSESPSPATPPPSPTPSPAAPHATPSPSPATTPASDVGLQ
jgi:hypothetical protein